MAVVYKLRKFSLGFRLAKQFSLSSIRKSVLHAELIKRGESLKVELSDNRNYEFPSLFLQDNCTCSKCFHSSSKSRSRRMTELNISNSLESVEYSENEVKCTWKDGHKAIFTEDWLVERRFTVDNMKKRKAGMRDGLSYINSMNEFHTETFENVINDKLSLLATLKNLCKTGVALISGVPLQVGELRKFAEKIGFIRLTHYGYEFTVKSEKNAVNLAYTSNSLAFHTDLPFYAYPPGVQLLHCIKQYSNGDTSGGQSQLVDGFKIANLMRKEYPNEFKILCDVPLEFYDIGKDYTKFHKIHHTPTFMLNEKNQITRICYNNQVLSSFQPIPLYKVESVYKALKLFTDLCYKSENLMQFHLKEGEILLFDNWRMLHGREGYDPNAGERHLEGCYIDWDEIFSRIRTIEG